MALLRRIVIIILACHIDDRAYLLATAVLLSNEIGLLFADRLIALHKESAHVQLNSELVVDREELGPSLKLQHHEGTSGEFS